MHHRDESVLRRALFVAAALVLLTGCEFVDQALLPAATGEFQGRQSDFADTSQLVVPLGTSSFAAPGVFDYRPTGTAVSEQIRQLRGQLIDIQDELDGENARLQSLRSEARTASNRYASLATGIDLRLREGAAPGDPELERQWQRAQEEMENVSGAVASIDALQNEVYETAVANDVLLDGIIASFKLRGFVDDDQRQLIVLQGEAEQTAGLIRRMLNEMQQDVTSASGYLAQQRSNLAALSTGIDEGRAVGTTSAADATARGVALVGTRQPLVVIRFDRPDVDYEAIIYSAMSEALARRPNAVFDLVGLAPAAAVASGDANRSGAYVGRVYRSLINMGLPPERMSLSATSSDQVQYDEVHIYVL
jgi:major membrane immunogen (membrane-anchored lipoprotein)